MRTTLVGVAVLAAMSGCTTDQGGSGTDGDEADVTVAVRGQDGAPIAGASVLLHDASGVFLESTSTDAAGAASVTLPAGGSVTVFADGPLVDVDGTSGDATFYASVGQTILGVEDGDALSFVLYLIGDLTPAAPAVLGTAMVQLPGAFTDATLYQAALLGGCAASSGDAGTLSFVVTDECLPSTTSVTPLGLAYTAGESVAFSLGTPVSPSAVYAGTQNLPAWRTDWTGVDLEVIALPATATNVGFYFEQKDAADRSLFFRGITATPAGGAFSDVLDLLPVDYDAVEWTMRAGDLYSGSTEMRSAGAVSGPLAELSVSGAGLLGLVQSMSIAVAGSSASIAWSADGADAADWMETRFYWYDGGVVYPDSHFVDWTIVGPAAATGTIVSPALPDAWASARPSRVETGFNLFVHVHERDDVDGYAAARGADRVTPPASHLHRVSSRRLDDL